MRTNVSNIVRRGISYVELLLTILILGIIAALAIPNVSANAKRDAVSIMTTSGSMRVDKGDIIEIVKSVDRTATVQPDNTRDYQLVMGTYIANGQSGEHDTILVRTEDGVEKMVSCAGQYGTHVQAPGVNLLKVGEPKHGQILQSKFADYVAPETATTQPEGR